VTSDNPYHPKNYYKKPDDKDTMNSLISKHRAIPKAKPKPTQSTLKGDLAVQFDALSQFPQFVNYEQKENYNQQNGQNKNDGNGSSELSRDASTQSLVGTGEEPITSDNFGTVKEGDTVYVTNDYDELEAYQCIKMEVVQSHDRGTTFVGTFKENGKERTISVWAEQKK